MTNSNFTIREIFDESWEFFKEHYEYLLPFSLIYFVIQSPSYFIDNLYVILPLTLILIPLSMSVPYYAHRMESGDDKRFSVLFDTVRYFFKILAINILRVLAYMLLFLPFALFFTNNFIDFEALKGVDMINFNEKLSESIIKSPDLIKDMDLKSFFGITGLTMVLAILIAPLLSFAEYYAVLGGYGVFDSFKHSIQDVWKNYGKVLLIIIVSALMVVPAVFTCGIGLIFVFPILFLMYYYTYKKISA